MPRFDADMVIPSAWEPIRRVKEKPRFFRALKLGFVEGFQIRRGTTVINGNPGDYLIIDDLTNEKSIVTEAEFLARFEIVGVA